MFIHVRSADLKQKVTLNLSKTSAVLELKNALVSHFGIQPERQRLFFRGKQLEDGYTLFDYNINLNDVIQIMEKVIVTAPQNETTTTSAAASSSSEPSFNFENFEHKSSLGESVSSSEYFMVGEFVDARDTSHGAWFEGRLSKIYKDQKYEENKNEFKEDEASGFPHDGYFYEVTLMDDGKSYNFIIRLVNLKPRAQKKLQFEDLKVGANILVNYNIEDPTDLGFWYLGTVTELKARRAKAIFVTLHISSINGADLKNCQVVFKDDIYEPEDPKPLAGRTPNVTSEPELRNTDLFYCTRCKNNPKQKCKECGCHVCGLKTEESKQLMCDECNCAFHIWCLKKPLADVPDVDEWYCEDCKNDENEIVSAGSKLKESKKKAKMASKTKESSRDWGKGMACVARTKACTIVSQDHFGAIPGIEVGTTWKFRIQVSEAGVHRPHVAGIHGRENLGAFSVVLSGGYEDDVDNGNEFYYTGSGGRDLSGNKRTNAQTFDQTLTRFNKAIALNCNAPLNQKGAEAKDWRAGKPVRVVRNYKLSKHSKYAPEDGNRYDGLYKVIKYFPEKGKSGFVVWRYLFRRDDPSPAPWTKEGKIRIATLGLEMEYPEGFIQPEEGEKKSETPKAKGKKRVLEESATPQPEANLKKQKTLGYNLDKDILNAIKKDTVNEKIWLECNESLEFGKSKFLSKVTDMFTCVCCTELVYHPITTPCQHNFCSACIRRSFKADVKTCPTCRNTLEDSVLKDTNEALKEVLEKLFPGYVGAN